MVKLILPVLSFSASGTICDALSFQRGKGFYFVKRIGIPPKRKSLAQTFINQAYSIISYDWQLAPPSIKSFFNDLAQGKTQSGFNSCIEYYIILRQSSKFGEAKFGWSKFA